MTKALSFERVTGTWLFGVSSWISVMGCTLLAVILAIGFEETSSEALLVPTLMMAALPTALLGHLMTTSHLTIEDKKVWLRELAGPRFPWALGAYLRCRNRSALARRMARRSRSKEER